MVIILMIIAITVCGILVIDAVIDYIITKPLMEFGPRRILFKPDGSYNVEAGAHIIARYYNLGWKFVE